MHVVTTPGQTEQVSISPHFRRLKQFESAINHHHERRLKFKNESRLDNLQFGKRKTFGLRHKRYEPTTQTFKFDAIVDTKE